MRLGHPIAQRQSPALVCGPERRGIREGFQARSCVPAPEHQVLAIFKRVPPVARWNSRLRAWRIPKGRSSGKPSTAAPFPETLEIP